MNKWIIIGLIVIAGFVSCLVLGGIVISKYNTCKAQQNTYEAKLKANTGEFDNMWKKISQVCQIADNKKEAFKEIFVAYATARTPEGAGKIMFWVKENAPNLDLKVYDNAQNIIVASRDAWTMRQTELVDIAREYNLNLVQFPWNFILPIFGLNKIDAKVITSSRTEAAFESGKDDNINLK